MSTDRHREQGRAAFARHAWQTAYEQLRAADAAEPLPPEDVERLATAAYLAGKDQEAVELTQRVSREASARGNSVAAAQAAFWVALLSVNRGDLAQAGGWARRGQRLIEDTEPTPTQGYFVALAGEQLMASGDLEGARERFAEAHAMGRRFDDPDLTALGCLGQGQALILLGRGGEGTPFLDEVMVAVTADEVSPVVAGIVYCGVIDACQRIFDIGRAREWTGALSAWCQGQPDLVPYRGQCLVHRAQIMRLNGLWADALAESERALAALAEPAGNPAQGAACYEQAELRRLRGEHRSAEVLYRRGAEWGHSPQPGLALLRLARGRVQDAQSGIGQALREVDDPMDRLPLLAASVEIALAAGAVSEAREAAEELVRAADEEGGTDYVRALALHACAAVALATGGAQEARAAARDSLDLWRRLDLPFHGARSRVVLGRASQELGDGDAARLELDAARRTFENLHAADELEALGSAAPRRGELSPREVEVLRLVARGKTNRAVADELVLSEKTVARHLANIYAKLSVSSRSAATAYAFEHDLV